MISLIRADALRIPLADASVQMCVTSPPYYALRDYGIPGQLGLEATPDEFVANMVAVFREVWRVLRDDGTLWLNLGDSYGGGNGGDATNSEKQKSNRGTQIAPRRGNMPKQLIGIPWRVAFALQADGWYLRSDIIWAKPNPMPESVTDRPTKSHEYLFLLAKQPRYYYDAEAIKEPAIHAGRIVKATDEGTAKNGQKGDYGATAFGFTQHDTLVGDGRNRRTVWTIATQSYAGAHFATFPEALVEPCIRAGTSERGCCPVCGAGWVRVVERKDLGLPQSSMEKTKAHTPNGGHHGSRRVNVTAEYGKPGSADFPPRIVETTGWAPACDHAAKPVPCTVLDPFAGTATSLRVAARLGRRGIGLDLQPDYFPLARQRTAEIQMEFSA